MKVDINYFIESREEHGMALRKPSGGFVTALRKQVFHPLQAELYRFFPTGSIRLVQFGTVSYEERSGVVTGRYDGYRATFIGYDLFSFTLYWKSTVDGRKITPFDDIDAGAVAFLADGLPTETELKSLAERNRMDIERFQKRKKEKAAEKKYRFKFVVRDIGEEVKLILDTEEPPEVLEKVIAEAVADWNGLHSDALIHNVCLTEVKQKKLTFVFNRGSGTERTLDFLLQKLQDTSLIIKKITLDS